MKRSEINVGDELYYDRRRDWETSAYGQKAVIVDTAPYRIQKASWGWIRKDTYSPNPKGNAVLVDLHSPGGKVARTAVPIAHLRGPYTETLAAVEKTAAQAKTAQAAESKAREDAWANASHVNDRARSAGIRSDLHRDWSSAPQISVSVEDFAKLLDAYASGQER